MRENVKLGAANSTIGALLTRGAPMLCGGIIQVEREAEGRVSLSRYMDVEPWFEITNPGCLDDAIEKKKDYGAIPAQKIVLPYGGLPPLGCLPGCSTSYRCFRWSSRKLPR